MMTTESFIEFFKVVFNNYYTIDVRLNNIFNSGDIKNFLDGKTQVNQLEYSMGYENDQSSLPPKLLIVINQLNSTSPTLANGFGLIYTRIEYFFRMYTKEDIGILNQRLIIGIRQTELLSGLGLDLNDRKISTALSLDGIKSLTGNISWAGYFHRQLESRPYDNMKIDLGLDNGKE